MNWEKGRKWNRICSSVLAFILSLMMLILIWPDVAQAYVSTINSKAFLSLIDPFSTSKENTSHPLVCVLEKVSGPIQQESIQVALQRYELLTGAGLLRASDHRLAGQAYCQVGEYEQALASFHLAHRLLPQDALSSQELLALYIREGDRVSVETLLDEGNLATSDILSVAKEMTSAGRLDDALTLCLVAVHLNPAEKEIWSTWHQIGIAYEKKQDWLAAENVYRSALSNQERAGVNIYRGSFYFHLGFSLYNQAGSAAIQPVLEQYDLAIADGNFTDPFEKANAYLYRGNWYRAHRKQYKPDQYMKDFQTAFQMNPRSAWAAEMIGVVYLQDDHQLDQAEQYIRLAISLASQNDYYYDLLGMVLAEKGDFKAAVDAFQSALRINPASKDAQIRLHAAQAKLEGKTSP